MTKSDYVERGFLYPDNMPDTFFLGNDEDWSLETYEGKELVRICKITFVVKYLVET